MTRYILYLSFLGILVTELHSQNTLQVYSNKAQNALNEENYTEAIKYISKLLENKSAYKNLYTVSDLYINRSYCRRKLGNLKDAEQDINEALKLTPEYLKLFENKNYIYLELKDYQKVIDNSKKVLVFDPKNTDFLLWVGEGYFLKKEYDRSLSFVDTVLNINTNDLGALRLQSSIFFSQKKYEQSVDVNNKILSQRANDPGAYLNRAISYARLKKYDEAVADNDFAAKIDTSLKHIVLNNVAFFIKLDQKDYAGAMELLDKCLKLKPNFAFGYSNRGLAKLKLGDVNGAVKDLQKSIELDPVNSYAYKNYALIRIEQKKITEACALLKKAKDLGYSEEYDTDVEELQKVHCSK